MEKILKDRIIKYLPLLLFGITTFCLMFSRVPFWDEANAWLIAQNFTVPDLFQVVEKYDGHLFIWHSLLMPFAKANFYYPYPMYVLNWLFCMTALFVFWKKAPFSYLLKTLITFSLPFFWYFSMVGRCYSLSILSLFLLLSFYKDRLKRPVLFSILLVFAANTSAMAIFGAFILGLMFIYDLIKSKNYKKCLVPFLIMISGAVIVGIQLLGAYFPEKIEPSTFLEVFGYYFFFYPREKAEPFYITVVNFIFSYSSLVLFILFFINYQKQKRGILFYSTVCVLLFVFFLFVYSGQWWHFLFFYIYFILSLWLVNLDSKEEKIKKPFYALLIFFLSFYCFRTLIFKFDGWAHAYRSYALTVANEIKRLDIVNENSKIYTPDNLLDKTLSFVPYFKDLKIYDTKGWAKFSKTGFALDRINHLKFVDVDEFAEVLDRNKANYMVTEEKKLVFVRGKKHSIRLKTLSESKDPYYAIFQIIYDK